MLFRGLRPSASWGFPFWLLGLTVQSSRPVFGGRLTFGVRLLGGANLAAQRLAFTEPKLSQPRVSKSHELMQTAEKRHRRSDVVE